MIKRNKTRISLFRKEIRAARWRKLPAALTDTVEHSYSFLGISRAKVLWIKFVSMWFCIGMSIRMRNGFSIYHNICRTSLPWSPRQYMPNKFTLKSSASRQPLSDMSFTPGNPRTTVLMAQYWGWSFHVAGSVDSQSSPAPINWKRNHDWGPMKSWRRFLLKSGLEESIGSKAGFGVRRRSTAIADLASSSTRSEKNASGTCRSSRCALKRKLPSDRRRYVRIDSVFHFGFVLDLDLTKDLFKPTQV